MSRISLVACCLNRYGAGPGLRTSCRTCRPASGPPGITFRLNVCRSGLRWRCGRRPLWQRFRLRPEAAGRLRLGTLRARLPLRSLCFRRLMFGWWFAAAVRLRCGVPPGFLAHRRFVRLRGRRCRRMRLAGAAQPRKPATRPRR